MAVTPAICLIEFKDALRAVPDIGDHVDIPKVEKNLAALGLAVNNIVANRAEGLSNAAADAAFWAWVSSVQAWLQALYAWQQATEGLTPTGVAVGPPPAAAPTSLTVSVQ
jgi:hypothetical protein